MSGDGAFAGRRILVTGAASGIGRAASVLLAERGARLAVLDIDERKLAALAASIGACAIAVDLADAARCVAAVGTAARDLEGLDGIVNCAGVALRAPLADLEPGLWAHTVALNLTAPYLICRAALPHLRASSRSSIVNIASGAGLLPGKGTGAAYAATKAGLIGFTKALAAELAPHIRVNALCPGLTATPMVESLLAEGARGGRSPADAYALGRAADPAEIASAIAFLLGDEASFITGSTLVVDGGRTFH